MSEWRGTSERMNGNYWANEGKKWTNEEERVCVNEVTGFPIVISPLQERLYRINFLFVTSYTANCWPTFTISDKKLKQNGNGDQRQSISPPIQTNKAAPIKSLPQRPPMLQRSKRLVPSIDVSVQQTLNEHSMAPLVIEQNSAVKINASEPYASYNILSPRARTTLKVDFHSPRTASDDSSGSRKVS